MTEKFFKSLEYELKQANIILFEYAWREKTDEWLKSESKYTHLIDWINSAISDYRKTIAIFSPCDNPDSFEQYRQSLADLAFLVQARDSILDSNCTVSMRAAWEQKICEVFKIKYFDFLGVYN